MLLPTGRYVGAPTVIGTLRDRRSPGWFDRLALPHLNTAYSFARWLTGNDDDACHVVREAYLRAFRDFDNHHGDAKSRMLKAVRNTFYDWLARDRAAESPSRESDGGRTRSSRSDGVSARRSAASLDQAIGSLPVEWRETIILRELHGLGYHQIAEITEVPIATIVSRLRGARCRLLEAIDGAPPDGKSSIPREEIHC
jgi:RNA polymerase sigma-70 factor (ECF subfamily)